LGISILSFGFGRVCALIILGKIEEKNKTDIEMAKIMRNFIRSTLAGMFLILNKVRISFMNLSCNNPN